MQKVAALLDWGLLTSPLADKGLGLSVFELECDQVERLGRRFELVHDLLVVAELGQTCGNSLIKVERFEIFLLIF